MKKFMCYTIFLGLLMAFIPTNTVVAQNNEPKTAPCGKNGTNSIINAKGSNYPKTKADGTPAWTEDKAKAKHRENYKKFGGCDKETCIDENYEGCTYYYGGISNEEGKLQETETGWKSGTQIDISWWCSDCVSNGPGKLASTNTELGFDSPAIGCDYLGSPNIAAITSSATTPMELLVFVDVSKDGSSVQLQITNKESGDTVVSDNYVDIEESYLYLPADLSSAKSGNHLAEIFLNGELIANCNINVN